MEILKRRESLEVRQIEGDTVILDLDNESMHSLNPTAALIFDQINGRSTLCDIVNTLVDTLAVARDVAECDTIALIAQMRELKLLV